MRTDKNRDNGKGSVFELLAPAGTYEIFQAVIAAGADAVYVGGDRFGARAYAGNFSDEELLRAIDYAHLHGRRLYLTVNTLLKNTELSGLLYDYLLPFYERGLDAVLVQDLGALTLIHQCFPELPIHTSTQMTVTGVQGARLMQELGAERIVMARETSLAEMKHIHEQTGVELEAFVHGALCYSYSGQCLFSSMLGKRSGNRGRCAQPCRLAYTVLGADGECMPEAYVLSLKDMCGLEDLNRLWAAGVYSLKIEGRMKQLPYAAGVVSYYRKYIDLFDAQEDKSRRLSVTPADMQELRDLGNRCGFTDSYYSRHNDRSMVTFVKPGYERQNEILQEQIVSRVSQPLKRHASGRLVLRPGEAAQYEVSCGEYSVCVRGMPVTEALNKPLVEEEVRERMCRTGESDFVMDEVAVELPGQVFLPNGALNKLRRDALDALKSAVLLGFRRSAPEMPEYAPAAKDPGNGKRHAGEGSGLYTICSVEGRDTLSEVLSHEIVNAVYLDAASRPSDGVRSFLAELTEDVSACRAAGKEVWLALPRIFRLDTARRYEKMLPQLCALPLDGVLVRNYEELQFARTCLTGFRIAADHSLYTCNDLAVCAFAGLGAERNTVPLELNQKEIAHRGNRDSEMVVYGHYPLMVSAQCVRKNVSRGQLGCVKDMGGKTGRGGEQRCDLLDRYRARFPVKNYCGDCYNVIFNSLPTLLFARMEKLKQAGISRFRLDFSVEPADQVQRILALYEEFAQGRADAYPKEWQNRYTNGHYQRGVE